MYEQSNRPLRVTLKDAHQQSWALIAAAGEFWTGAERIEIATESRIAQDCKLCEQRKAALSPFAITGSHTTTSSLPTPAVDVIHRLATDPGRLTKAWFDEAVANELTVPAYVELVSVVTSTVIVDTQHRAVGLAPPALPDPVPGTPTGNINKDAVEAGAWVPIATGSDAVTDTGLPQGPNIARSMGLVPSAVALFFNTFRAHYALQNIPLDISQPQAEFIASRVSAHNLCFY